MLRCSLWEFSRSSWGFFRPGHRPVPGCFGLRDRSRRPSKSWRFRPLLSSGWPDTTLPSKEQLHRAVLKGFLDRLLGGIALPGEILTDGADGHLEAELHLDQLPDRLAIPERKEQLQLIWVMINDHFLDLLFLLSREVPFLIMLSAPFRQSKHRVSISQIPFPPTARCLK